MTRATKKLTWADICPPPPQRAEADRLFAVYERANRLAMAASAKRHTTFLVFNESLKGRDFAAIESTHAAWQRAHKLDERRFNEQEAAWAAWDAFTSAAARKQEKETGR